LDVERADEIAHGHANLWRAGRETPFTVVLDRIDDVWKSLSSGHELVIEWPSLQTSVSRPSDGLESCVERLADPARAQQAFWHLVLSGADAVPAVRHGLHHPTADVRMYCTKALDHLVDASAFSQLVAMLDDADARVRREALHALACDR